MIQCAIANLTETTFFQWRLSAKSAPEVPRFIVIGFQTAKINNQEQNPAIFDYINVSKISVSLNSIKYPKTYYRISFDKYQFSRIYGDAAIFRSKFYNIPPSVSNPNIFSGEYKDLYPLFFIDVSKQTDSLQYSTTDIQIEVETTVNIPAETIGYAVLLSDRLAHFQSDGSKFSFEY